MKDHKEVAQWCKDNCIDMVVVGPEDPLAAGIVDDLTEQGKIMLSGIKIPLVFKGWCRISYSFGEGVGWLCGQFSCSLC